MLPSHSNFGGKIHGGYLLQLMDQIAFASASKYSGKYCVTASVDTVDFLNPGLKNLRYLQKPLHNIFPNI